MGVLAVFAVAVLLLWWRFTLLPPYEHTRLGLGYVYVRLWHRWVPSGPCPWPSTGAAILVSNHTASTDAIYLLAACRRKIAFLTSRAHYEAHPASKAMLDFLQCVPVQRFGRDVTAVRQALRRLAEGKLLAIFPEGNLSGVGRGRLSEPKHGAAYLALKSGLPIYPVHIGDGPQTENILSAWLGGSRRRTRISFGPAVDLSAYRGQRLTRRVLHEVTLLLMARVGALAASGAGSGR